MPVGPPTGFLTVALPSVNQPTESNEQNPSELRSEAGRTS